MFKPEALFNVPFELLMMGAAVKTGMIEILKDKVLTQEELAAELKADQRAVWNITEALAATGYLSKQGKLITLSKELKEMLYNPDSPNFIGFSFMHRYNILKSWLNLPEVIISGKPNRDDFASEETAYFMAAMRHAAVRSAPAIADFLLDQAGEDVRVLDIGGGPLIYARAFAEHGAKVTVLDLPRVVDLMNEEAKVSGIKMVPGDFNVKLPDGPFDLAYLSSICHIFGEQENRELFKKTHAVLVSGGRIAVSDFIRGINPFAAVFGVNMLANTANGDTFTLEQYTQWLEAAGFSNIQLCEVVGRQIITAFKV